MNCNNCIHLSVCGKYDYDEDRKDCIDYKDETKYIDFSKLIGTKVKVLADMWGNVWNYPTIEHGKYIIGEIVSITRTKKQTLIKIRAKHNVEWKRICRRVTINAIGKTVFLINEVTKNE